MPGDLKSARCSKQNRAACGRPVFCSRPVFDCLLQQRPVGVGTPDPADCREGGVLKLEQLQDGNRKEIGQTKLTSLSPYGKTNVRLTPKIKFEKGKAYDFVLTIRTSDDVVSTFTFQTTPVE